VDPDNNGNPNDASAMWTPGETFTDAANGIEVKVTGATANGFGVTINPSDTTAPRIQGSDPSPGQRGVGLKPTIEVTFSEEVDTTTLTPANVELNRSGVTTPVAATVKPSPDGRSVTLVPGRLKKGKRYYVVLRSDSQGIKDLAGNPLSGGGGSLVNESGEYVYWWFMTRR
jgi:hypothetical protein